MDENEKLEKNIGENGDSQGNGQDQDAYRVKVVDLEDSPEGAERFEGPVSVDEKTEQQKEIEALRKEKDDLYDRLLRKHADFENFRKRTEKEKREFQTYALSEFTLELLSILDNFERALAHSDEQSGVDYRKGVELIYRQFRDLLEKKGLRAIETMGQTFDPNFHEAILREERNDLPENTILSEMQKGYFFRDKLLRPAMVKVSYRTEDATADPEIEIVDVE